MLYKAMVYGPPGLRYLATTKINISFHVRLFDWYSKMNKVEIVKYMVLGMSKLESKNTPTLVKALILRPFQLKQK